MSAISQAFERSIHRIHELIEQPGTEVTWNDRMPDPDNPRQKRQIDISLRSNGRFTIVECRLHQTRQDVKWIEELVGRRASLNADGVIAVSDSGFTDGAIIKARRFGIVLRDLHNLSEAEVSAWGQSHTAFLYLYVFTDVELTLTFARPGFATGEAEALAEEFRKSSVVSAIFNTVIDQADSRQLLYRRAFELEEAFEYTLKRENFAVFGRDVSTVRIAGRVSLVECELDCLVVRAYGSPEAVGMDRNVFLERFALGQTEVVHEGASISFIVDVSSFKRPPLSQLCYVRLQGEVETEMSSFEIIGVEQFQLSSGPINLTLETGNA
jgi:Restriction endonuclease